MCQQRLDRVIVHAACGGQDGEREYPDCFESFVGQRPLLDRLVALGYAERADDPADARRRLVRLTERGYDLLARSAAIFDQLRADWAAVLGEKRLRAIEDDLYAVAAPGAFRLDAAGWIGGMG